MSNDFVSKSIKGILLNGINLNLENIEEEQHYIYKMLEYFESKTKFTAYLRKDRTLEVETPEMQVAMEIHIVDSTLFMVPYSQDIFEIFTEVLRFVSTSHEHILREFRGIEENKIESVMELNKRVKNEVQQEESEEETSSDDDFEWI